MAFLFVCLFSFNALAAEEKGNFPNAIGEVIYKMGLIQAKQPDGATRRLKLGSPVIPLDMIITSSNSNVEIRFKDETVYAQGEDSSISLDDFVYSQDPAMSKLLFKMGKGTFRFVTGEIVKQNPDAFVLGTPLATIGIRGTEPFAVISNKKEQIGVISIDPAHTVNIKSQKTSVTINKPGMMTSISPDGSMSPPAATPGQVQQGVINSAPMTSKGESGSVGGTQDSQSKIKAFKQHMSRAKAQIGDINSGPDYGKLHTISVQQNAKDNAASEGASGSSRSGGSDGGGGGDSGGGGGGCG